jgi:TonB family protein
VGPWTVETADSMCLVGRKFSASGSEITLGFRKVATTDNFQILIWRAGKSTKASKGTAQLAFDQVKFEASYVTGPVNIRGMDLTEIATKRSDVGGLVSSKTLNVVADSLATSFNLRGIGGAMKALDDCEKELLASWGLNPANMAAIKTPASIKNVMSLFSTDDYPGEALRRGEQGISAIRYIVEADGRVRDCHVTVSSGSSSLDAKTCEIHVTRARYEPARTATGEAVPSIVFTRMRWKLP